jgi:hypothetical protein
MPSSHTPKSLDIAQVRVDNALTLFDEYVRSTVSHADAATLRGLERRFAERLQIQPSYWSQIKSRSRQIGERLARQFETLSKKPYGWMDVPHSPLAADQRPYPYPDSTASSNRTSPTSTQDSRSFAQLLEGKSGRGPVITPSESSLPQDDDERFVVGLVLAYYRRNPQRAKSRLMELLSEVLFDPAAVKAGAAAKTQQTLLPLKPKK